MPSKKLNSGSLVDQSVAVLESVGLQQAFDSSLFEKMVSPVLGKIENFKMSFPLDDTKQTMDIVFDELTGDILGWRKTPRSVDKNQITLNFLKANFITPSKIGSVRTFIIDKIINKTVIEAAEEIDEAIKNQEVLQLFDRDLKLLALSQKNKNAMQGQRVLLLVHGIFSKTKSAFEGLVKSYDELATIYSDRIIAYDHFTLSKSTRENAKDLLEQLPGNVEIDIICHSRGAGVVRFLVEQASNRQKLKNKGITIGKVCFVAGACEGSPLATKESADNLFKLLTLLFSLSGVQGPLHRAIGLLIRDIVSGVQAFPGVKSMDPFGADVIALAGSEATAANHYYYIRANYDPKNLAVRFGDDVLFDLALFKGEHNDVIVPWKGASSSTRYLKNFLAKDDLLGFSKDGTAQENIWHINFFNQEPDKDQVRKALVKVLT